MKGVFFIVLLGVIIYAYFKLSAPAPVPEPVPVQAAVAVIKKSPEKKAPLKLSSLQPGSLIDAKKH